MVEANGIDFTNRLPESCRNIRRRVAETESDRVAKKLGIKRAQIIMFIEAQLKDAEQGGPSPDKHLVFTTEGLFLTSRQNNWLADVDKKIPYTQIHGVSSKRLERENYFDFVLELELFECSSDEEQQQRWDLVKRSILCKEMRDINPKNID